MTRREAAIVSAYTGFMLGDFQDMHEYAEELMGRSIFAHEFGSHEFAGELRQKAKQDFANITITDAEEATA